MKPIFFVIDQLALLMGILDLIGKFGRQCLLNCFSGPEIH